VKALTPLLFGALLLVGAIPVSAQTATPTSSGWVDPRHDVKTEAKLESISVSVNWKKVDVSQVLHDLETKSKNADPHDGGLHFKLNLPKNASEIKSHGYPVRREVSIVLENGSLSDVLAYICQQTNLVVRAHNGVVTLTTWDAQDQEAALHAPPMTL
jgi:hypothetical protein